VKRGKKLNLHGAFGSKAKARAKEKRVRGGFILTRKVKGDTRYIVVSRKGK
jgi:hypothetical protein